MCVRKFFFQIADLFHQSDVLGEGDEIDIVVRGRGRDMIAGEVAAFAATAGDGAIEAEALARAALVLN